MAIPNIQTYVQKRPRLLLTITFVLWKLLLLLIACLSPGIGYDTSTDLYLASSSSISNASFSRGWNTNIERLLASKLVRWDSLYFIAIAERGYMFEQERAFGWGFPTVVTKLASLFSKSQDNTLQVIAMSVFVANLSHFLSVLVLERLCRKVTRPGAMVSLPLVSALLHIFAPAGIFLCSPYGESLFALLCFCGYFCHANSFILPNKHDSLSYYRDLQLLTSGVLFGFAATVRSNGIFNGVIFLYDLFELLASCSSLRALITQVRHITCIVVAGVCVAVGFIAPQYFAYIEMCTGKGTPASIRPWCTKFMPSIYVFVQEHYWGVGFMRYWTISNTPLFLVALPMLVVLLLSAMWAWRLPATEVNNHHAKEITAANEKTTFTKSHLTRLAIPQILVAMLACTNFHVQIITRIASAYPLQYFWLASMLVGNRESSQKMAKWTIRWMIMYAWIQGGLFASFLPPA